MTNGHEYSVDTARQAAERDRLAEWVAEFLASPGSDNAPLADKLADPRHWWTGPMQLPIDQLHRLAGPSDHPVLEPIDEEEWRDDVDELEDKVEEGWEPPPVIVTYRNGQLVLEDGNHRVEGLRRAGEHLAWAVVGFTDQDELRSFQPPAA
jgi:hypothetical protein